MIDLKRKLSGRVCLAFSLVSALLLSCGWIGAGGFPLVVALVPLLMISANLDASWRSTLKMLGYATLTFVVWNIATIWWVWNATPIGPIAATIFSTWWSLLAFMLYHIVSKRVPNGVALVLFVAAWIAGEYIYMEAPALSFPWLVLGNGFTADTWAVQWYEYTGVLGGSLWVLLLNVLALQSIRTMRKGVWLGTTFVFALPLIFSLVLYGINSPDGERYQSRPSVKISAIQPNVDCYKKFNSDSSWQQDNLMTLLGGVPDSVQFVLMPETSLSTLLREGLLPKEPIIERVANTLDKRGSDAMVIAGCETMRIYGQTPMTTTARNSGGVYFDIYNSAVGIEVEYDAVP
ncbi:MAG: apolipoprotein N-acyltransferase, partial [Alistipes sp.]|nr:apolipoprotein N-acyltransferase [Alistipes sp.]